MRQIFFFFFVSMIMMGVRTSFGEVAVTSGAKVDPHLEVDIYNPGKAFPGTTLLPDHHDPKKTRVVEVDMEGRVIWEYVLPRDLRRYTNPGFDAERLPNNHILIVLPGKGLLEIDRAGKTVWSHSDAKISHDADRLPNGNTIYGFGNNDEKGDAQVKEINPAGDIVWQWYAKDHFDMTPYQNIYNGGWTHTNAVVRLESGHTLISPRNFNFLVEVDTQGNVVRKIGEEYLEHQHDPEVLANGNIVVANHGDPQEAIEIDAESGEIVWRYAVPKRKLWPLRDADRLPNGNTLITGCVMVVEVTPGGEIVWRLKLKDVPFSGPKDAPSKGFYKAQRISV